MQRRDFARSVTVLGFTGLIAAAQQHRRVRRIGALLLMVEDDLGRSRLAVFQRRLDELGWRSGDNISLDVRWAGDDYQRARGEAAELVRTTPDVLFVLGTGGVAALLQQTRTIPIVFVQVTDPVAAGFVTSLSAPGGNVTGFANFGASVGGERLRLLHEIAPQLHRALIIFEADTPLQPGLFRSTEQVAASVGVQLTREGVRDASTLEHDVGEFAREPNSGLVIVQGLFTTKHRERIVALAARHRLPAVYPLASFVEIGGLVSYGVNVPGMWQDAAGYINRILRGATPGTLPVQEPAQPEIVVNLGTAKNLGLPIPAGLQARATKVVG